MAYLDLLIYGVFLGSVYGLSTMGLSLLFGIVRVVNVSHGSLIMLGAYTAYWLFTLYSINPISSGALAALVGAALGAALYYPVLTRLMRGPEMASLIATFGLGVFFEELAKFLWTADYRGIPWSMGRVEVLGVSFRLEQLVATLVTALVALSLYLLLYRTRLGLAVRAVVQNVEGAYVSGINVQRIYMVGVCLGVALTMLGGSLITLFIPVGINPYMGFTYTLYAFVIAVLGGLGNIWGTYAAGFIFAFATNLPYIVLTAVPGINPLPFSTFLAFALLLIILLIKPSGLMGR